MPWPRKLYRFCLERSYKSNSNFHIPVLKKIRVVKFSNVIFLLIQMNQRRRKIIVNTMKIINGNKHKQSFYSSFMDIQGSLKNKKSNSWNCQTSQKHLIEKYQQQHSVFFVAMDRYHIKVTCKRAFSFTLTHKNKKEITIVLEEVVLHC